MISSIIDDERRGKVKKQIQYLDKEIIKIEIPGKKTLKGIIVEVGSDVFVLFDGKDYFYIPIAHIHQFQIDYVNEDGISMPSETTGLLNKTQDELTFERVLALAVDIYSEIYVTGNQSLHGYISNIMSDYFVFQSPVYKTMYIGIEHLKWLIPYNHTEKPYGLSKQDFTIQSIPQEFPNTFQMQIETMKDKFVVFNLGEKENHSGSVRAIKGQFVELQTARANANFLNLLHIKTIHY